MNKRPGLITFFAVLQFLEATTGSFLAIGAFNSGDLGFGILLIVLAGFSIPIGFGMLRLKNWARILLIIKSIPELLLIPIGTIPAGAAIYYFTRRKAKSYFVCSPKMEPTPPIEDEAIRAAEEQFLIGLRLSRNDKDWRGAVSRFEEAVRLNPEHWRAYDEIAYWMADKLDDAQKGLKYAEKAIELVPKDSPSNYAAVLDTMGWCYLKLGRINDAKEYLEKAVKLQSPLDAFFILRTYHLLAVYERTENIEEAKEIYRKIAEMDPGDWIDAEAKEKAEEIIGRIKTIERKRDQHKIKELATIWSPICDIEDKSPPCREILDALKLLKHNRAKAKSKIQKLATDFPLDPVLIHSLSIMHYWEIKGANTYDNIGDFIAYWVRLMHLDQFWQDWAREREQFYFGKRIELERIDDLRLYLWEMIDDNIPGAYKGHLLLEKKTAEVIKALNEWGEDIGLNPMKIICGPIMLDELKMDGRVKKMAAHGFRMFPANSKFCKLMLYLSPFGLATVFIEEKNVLETFVALDKIKVREIPTTEIPEAFLRTYVDNILEIIEQEPSSEQKIAILEEALQRIEDRALRLVLYNQYINRANEFAKDSNWDQATTYLERAFRISSHSNGDAEDKLFICYLNLASSKLEADKPEEAELVIKKAESLKTNGDRRKNLADICFGCAIKFFDQDKPEKSEIMATKVEKYEPDNTQIKHFLEAIKALKKYRKEVLDQLIQARQSKGIDSRIEGFRKALKKAENNGLTIDARKEIKCELAGALNAKAVERANETINRLNGGMATPSEAEGILERSVRELQEARDLCPEEHTINNNLNGIRGTLSKLRVMSGNYGRIVADANIERIVKELMKKKY